jgi:DNA-binding SARP family transcriptional activator/tetratricopeptide (TPR) repeat protein
MARVCLELLGGFSARFDGGPPLVLPSRKAQALLAFLALPAGRWHSRETLATLFWGEAPEAHARQSLRQALAMLRRTVGDLDPPVLLTRPDALALDAESVAVDVASFEAALRDGGPDALARAAELYRGDLLDGLDVNEPGFEEWWVVERERLRAGALEGLAKLLRHQTGADSLEAATRTAVRLLAMDPLQEAVHRALMRLYVRQGRRAAALRQYQECVVTLQRELGVDPEEETRQLYRELLRGSGGAAAPGNRSSGGWTAEGAPGLRSLAGPLLGRQAELAELGQAMEEALDAGSRLVVLTGEAGIGKTRLLQEVAADARARGMGVMSAWCRETEQPLPFRPWVDAFRAERPTLDPALAGRLSAVSRAALLRVYPELAAAGGSPDTESDEHGLLFEAMGELTGLVAERGPVLIVLEDLHWADDMSVRLLAFLSRRLGALPVLIVGSTRPEEAVDTPVVAAALDELRREGRLLELAIGPLNREDSVALARASRGGADSDLVDRIGDDLWAISEGNPFVIVETMRALSQAALPAEVGHPLIAASVREAVARRLARLSEAARRAVDTSAVIGRAFSFRLLLDACGLSDAEAATAVEELVRRRVLDAAGEELVFCHDRIRQVAYDAVLAPRRVLLHRAVAHALESSSLHRLDEVAGELGHHFLRAGELESAILYLGRFAEIATRRYAMDAALAALTQADTAVEQLPPSSRDHRHLEVALRRAFVLDAAGRHHQCLDVLKSNALRQRRVPDPALAGEYHYRLAMTRFYLGDYAEARLAAAAALGDGERTGDRERVGRALNALALVSTAAGAPAEAMEYCMRAVELLDEPSTWRRLASAHWLLALNRIYTAQFDGALEHLERCVTLADAVGDAKRRSMAEGLESWVHAIRGDSRAAMDCAQRALEASRGTIPTSLALRWVGYAYLDQGDARAAIEVLERACEQIEHFPVRHTYVEALAFLAEAHVLAHGAARGLELARRATELAQIEGSPFNVGLAERAAGRAARASGDAHAGEAHLGRALDAFESTGATFEAAMTRLELARALTARGETVGAQAHLAEAIAALHVARVPRRVAEAQALARALGLEPRGAGPDVPDSAAV